MITFITENQSLSPSARLKYIRPSLTDPRLRHMVRKPRLSNKLMEVIELSFTY